MPRINSYIELTDYQNLYSSALQSENIGCPFDAHLVIHLEQLGFSPEECPEQWRLIRQKIKRFHERNNIIFACLWTFENVPSVGVHIHCLIYRGNLIHRSYRKLFLKAIGYPNTSAELIKIKHYHRDKTWRQNTDYLVKYICKGIRDEHRHLLTGTDCRFQGTVIGRRIGRTRNLI